LDVLAWIEGKKAGVRPVPEPEEELPQLQVVPSATTRCRWPSYRNQGNAHRIVHKALQGV